MARPDTTMFQSPLHRGTCFNTTKNRPPTINKNVSVPSSSGHMLQRRWEGRCWRRQWVSVPSSSGHMLQPAISICSRPLCSIVSVPSSSGHMLQLGRFRLTALQFSWFQSPLHRGTCFNIALEQTLQTGIARFSPLFIGAHASTKA